MALLFNLLSTSKMILKAVFTDSSFKNVSAEKADPHTNRFYLNKLFSLLWFIL